MTKYLAEVKDRFHYFSSYSFHGVERSYNTVVDALSKLAIMEVTSFGGLVYLEVLDASSVRRTKISVVERSNCWLTIYLDYLANEKLPSDRMLAKKIKHRSFIFV